MSTQRKSNEGRLDRMHNEVDAGACATAVEHREQLMLSIATMIHNDFGKPGPFEDAKSTASEIVALFDNIRPAQGDAELETRIANVRATRPPEAHHAAYATAEDYAAMVEYADTLEHLLRKLVSHGGDDERCIGCHPDIGGADPECPAHGVDAFEATRESTDASTRTVVTFELSETGMKHYRPIPAIGGNNVKVSESSSPEEPRLWFAVDPLPGFEAEEEQTAHLSPAAIDALIDTLVTARRQHSQRVHASASNDGEAHAF